MNRCRELGLIRERGRQRTDSTHVLAAVRMLNRLERVGWDIGTENRHKESLEPLFAGFFDVDDLPAWSRCPVLGVK